MKRFTDFTGLAIPYLRNNIDTDQLIPKQFLTSLTKTGYGLFLFNADRWQVPAAGSHVTLEELKPRADFVLNEKRYEGAQILISGSNFGCGSSREHAVWALMEYGFNAVIASGFADIFSSNSSKNGLLLISLEKKDVQEIADNCAKNKGFKVEIVLSVDKPYVVAASKKYLFEIASSIKKNLLAGMDEIAVTEQYADQIKSYEQKRLKEEPWLDPQASSSN